MDILISGVGGQGTILASKILACAMMLDGHNARTGETIGMSQRGGCVVSHVRSDANSPYIPLGKADMLLSFELCEGARNLPFLKKGGVAVINTAKITPLTVALGASTYDEDAIRAAITARSDAHFIDANAAAAEIGSVKAVNTLLVGAACGLGLLDIRRESILEAIRMNVAPKFHELNERAFAAGEALVRK
ncbi:MAG: indolepyruvate oxidoreductase subunit beta [Clostridia bacterium]|nr:indolepyruvate oxidoreductase subunit beta [Clostridia bacterium]